MLKLYVTMNTMFVAGMDRLRSDQEKGATAVEYGIMVALIAAVIIGIVATLGTEILRIFGLVAARLALVV